MNTSQKGLDLIKQFEGYRNKAYKCPAGVWTIGYGTTKYPSGEHVKEGDTCTKAQAQEYLQNDVKKFEKNVRKYNDKYHWNQNEFDALVSFAYNVGSIDQLTHDGTRDKHKIAEKMLEYDKANGKTVAGLTKRRAEEKKLFLTPAGM